MANNRTGPDFRDWDWKQFNDAIENEKRKERLRRIELVRQAKHINKFTR